MITIEILKKTIANLGYKWFDDQPNIIGVRSALNAPDVFNDIIFIVYSQNGVEKLFSATITTDPGVTYFRRVNTSTTINPDTIRVSKIIGL